MNNEEPFVDVCVVCAMAEEAKAFLKVVSEQCRVTFEERRNSRHGYDYRFAEIQNNRGERLGLHVSWLSRYGPQEMALHLPVVMKEYKPRFVVMTGICAGDKSRVSLGDLVVAERTYSFDNGKFIKVEDDRTEYLHDTFTYKLDKNVLSFATMFEQWKPLVAQLTHPLLLQETRCHIKPMASSNAVHSDNPFKNIQIPVRGAVAIDMEGAAFCRALEDFPGNSWLIVKGVSDYADSDKNDVYHPYASAAAAMYALCFIQEYVTIERLPKSNEQHFEEYLQSAQNIPLEGILEEKIERFKTLQMDIMPLKDLKEFFRNISLLSARIKKHSNQYERLYKETASVLGKYGFEDFEVECENRWYERLKEEITFTNFSRFQAVFVKKWGDIVGDWLLPWLRNVDNLLVRIDICIEILERYKLRQSDEG